MNNIQTYFDKLIEEESMNQTQIYSFGSNEMGQLGVIDTSNTARTADGNTYSSVPLNISFLNDKKIIAISAGDGHSICVTANGGVYAWGASACGQLGVDQNDQMQTDAEGYPFQPTPIQINVLKNFKIKNVACGDAHTLALCFDGQVFSWGGAGCGQLGHQNISLMPRDADACPYQPFPKLIDTLKGTPIIHIACGKAHSLAIDNTNALFTWGAGACGQLGVEDIHTLPVDDDGYPFQPVPKILKSLKGKEIVYGSCGDVHTVVLTKKGEIFAFGGGSFGQLGLGAISKMPLDSDSYPFMPTPSKIEVLSFISIAKISCGDSHTMAIDTDGKLYAWGAAACGQLGLENLANLPKDGEGNPYEPEPKLVSYFENLRVESVSCGESHTLVLIEGGTVYSFGNSSCGQLGYTDKKDKNKLSKNIQFKILESNNSNLGKPKLITSFLGKNVVKMSCGGVHNLCLTQSEVPYHQELFLLYKKIQLTDFEIIIDNSIDNFMLDIYKIKVHKFVLMAKSFYFYNKIIELKGKEQSLTYKNIDIAVFKNIIEYLYLDDLSFISDFKSADQLLGSLKLAKQFSLKEAENKIENKLKALLGKYSESLSSVDKSENLQSQHKNIESTGTGEQDNMTLSSFNKNQATALSQPQSSTKSFKGLFFLPNGNPIIIFDDELIEKIIQSSYSLTVSANNKLSVNLPIDEVHTDKNTKKISFQNINLFNDFNKLNLTSKDDLKDLLVQYGLLSNNQEIPLFLKFFNHKETSDITLKIDSYLFYCHKTILMSRSDIFKNMLSESIFKESKNNTIEISEYPPEDFLLFLLFIYADNLTVDIDKLLDLLKGVDVYAVQSLKDKLENTLSNKLEIDNVAKIFKYSSFYNHDRLKRIALAFINDNYKAVIDTEEFEELPREFMLEIIRFCKTK